MRCAREDVRCNVPEKFGLLWKLLRFTPFLDLEDRRGRQRGGRVSFWIFLNRDDSAHGPQRRLYVGLWLYGSSNGILLDEPPDDVSTSFGSRKFYGDDRNGMYGGLVWFRHCDIDRRRPIRHLFGLRWGCQLPELRDQWSDDSDRRLAKLR